ncbi:MAG: 16S rRNA (guanine(527)-N(7))-methyltransferase RsmG [Deltaproteobacteria bacterium]|nr:16S rRNA (guanine(527)-N(7))-methyltransferase RsmG [Deltaproteobacteria bacterium]
MSTEHPSDDAIASKLKAFQDLFLRWNERINLSAARTPAELAEHIQDCLSVIDVLRPCKRVLDVGSGGGLPVVVAAISLPETQFVALEPVHKKHAFLRTAARELKLANLEAFAKRLDDHDAHDYDAATSRATFDLPTWLDLGLQHVRTGGFVVGFEAQRRTDLPATSRRIPYGAAKSRALIILDKP